MRKNLYIEGKVNGYFTRKSAHETAGFKISDLDIYSIDIHQPIPTLDFLLDEHCVGSFYKPTYYHDIRLFVSNEKYLKVRSRDFVIRDIKRSDEVHLDGDNYIPFVGTIIVKIVRPIENIEVNADEILIDTSGNLDPNYYTFLRRIFNPTFSLFNRSNQSTQSSKMTEFFWGMIGVFFIGLLLSGLLSLFSATIFGFIATGFLFSMFIMDALKKRFVIIYNLLDIENPVTFLIGNILLYFAVTSIYLQGWSFGNFHLFLLAIWILLTCRKNKLIKWLGWMVIIFQIGYYIYQLNEEFKRKRVNENDVEYSEPDDESLLPDTRSDTAIIKIKDNELLKVAYLVHNLSWSDNKMNRYQGSFKIRKDHFSMARIHRENIVVNHSNSREYWKSIYSDLVFNNGEYLNQMITEYKRIIKQVNLNKTRAADMIVSSIQSIPYYLVHELSHQSADEMYGGFISEYHKTGGPCLQNTKFGLQSPTEFVGNLKGDCDTRSVLLYLVLNKLGHKTIILASDHYGHAIIGISGNYSGVNFRYKGIDYYAWETTSKGFSPGVLSDECGNPRYWYVALGN